MKDLEIIKTNVVFMQQCENTYEKGMQEAFENIICAAERMAAEIEQLRQETRATQIVNEAQKAKFENFACPYGRPIEVTTE